MGRYYTCRICGVSEKNQRPPCTCHLKRMNDLLATLVGQKIIGFFMVQSEEYDNQELVLKVQDEKGIDQVYYLVTYESEDMTVFEVDDEVFQDAEEQASKYVTNYLFYNRQTPDENHCRYVPVPVGEENAELDVFSVNSMTLVEADLLAKGWIRDPAYPGVEYHYVRAIASQDK